MEPLCRPLREAGYLARLVRLPGHGTSPEAFRKTFFADWAGAAEEEYRRLAAEVEHCVVIGLSMGGTLALRLAARYPVSGAVCMATPIYIFRYLPWKMQDWRLPFLPLLAKLRPVLKKRPKGPESREIAPWEGYEGAHYLPQLRSMALGVKAVRGELGKVTAPLLLVHDANDRVVFADNMWQIARLASSEDVRMRLTRIRERKTSRHLLTTHRETRELVAREITEFMRSVTG